MVVYIEYVLIDNMVIDTLILLLTCLLLKIRISKLRVFFASLFGTILAIIFPLIGLTGILSFVAKLLVGLIMISFLSNYKSFKKYLLTFICFVFITFLIGGACYGVLNFIGADIIFITGFSYIYNIPIGLIIGTVLIVAYFAFQTIKRFHKIKQITQYVYKTKLSLDGITIESNAFLDTGNRISDNNKPVVIISYALLNKIKKNIDITSIILAKIEDIDLPQAHYISINNASNKRTNMLVFTLDKLSVSTKDKMLEYSDVCVGVSFAKFNDYLDYDLLLNPLMFNL